MNKRVRLTHDEAKALGVPLKRLEVGRNTFRAYISQDQIKQLNEIKHRSRNCEKSPNQRMRDRPVD